MLDLESKLKCDEEPKKYIVVAAIDTIKKAYSNRIGFRVILVLIHRTGRSDRFNLIYEIIFEYFCRFSQMTHRLISKKINPMPIPAKSCTKWCKTIPTIIGSMAIAPNALYLGTAKRMPPTISTIATRGSIHLMVINAPITCIISWESSGMGM